jgi:hypothetical protein
MTIGERVSKAWDYLGLPTLGDFAEGTGIDLKLAFQCHVKGMEWPEDALRKISESYPQINFQWLLNEEGEMINQNAEPKVETKLVEKSAEWSEIEANMDEISAALKETNNTYYLEKAFAKYKIFDTADRIKVLNTIMESLPFPSKSIDDEYQTTKDVFLAIAWKDIGAGME